MMSKESCSDPTDHSKHLLAAATALRMIVNGKSPDLIDTYHMTFASTYVAEICEEINKDNAERSDKFWVAFGAMLSIRKRFLSHGMNNIYRFGWFCCAIDRFMLYEIASPGLTDDLFLLAAEFFETIAGGV
jgi:hypothetical protein